MLSWRNSLNNATSRIAVCETPSNSLAKKKTKRKAKMQQTNKLNANERQPNQTKATSNSKKKIGLTLLEFFDGDGAARRATKRLFHHTICTKAFFVFLFFCFFKKMKRVSHKSTHAFATQQTNWIWQNVVVNVYARTLSTHAPTSSPGLASG